MTHTFTFFLLNKIQAKKYMTEDEYENVAYSLEIFLINIFKTVQVYVIAYLLGVLFETFIMNLPYVLLRWHAGGWHAKSTINCSIFGITTFVGIPFILQKMDFSLSFFWMTILSLVILCCVLLYAPADTEKNPLVSVSERKRKRIFSFLSALFAIFIAVFFVNNEIGTLMITGLFVEIIMIHPLFYKLNKRSYKNYENYQVQP